MPFLIHASTAAKAESQNIVNRMSTIANHFAFAMFIARDHIGTAARYTKAGIEAQHSAKNHFEPPPVLPLPVKTAIVIQAAMKMARP